MAGDGAGPDPIGAPGFGTGVGTVVAFDPEVGLGRVAGDGGEWLFHCTAIADGSRTIEVGATVSFRRGPGGPGRWEAFDIAPAPGSS